MKSYGVFVVALFAAAASLGCDRDTDLASDAPPRPSAAAVVVQPAVAPAYTGPLVQLHGNPGELGAEHAQALDDKIRTLHHKYLDVYVGSGAKRFLALGAAKMFESYFRPEHLTEIDALAKRESMDEREAVLAQCFLDLSPMAAACSTITLPASASPDHVGRFGRNLEFSSLGVADKYSTVFIYKPEGRFKFAAIGWPGMIGVLSGMNEHGLSIANMEVSRGVRLPTAMPYTLLYRSVLERCKTVNEAIDLIEKTPRQTANNLMLMDATGDRAVVEITPDAVAVRRTADDQPLISTNHQRGTDCDTPGRCWRYDRLHEEGGAEFGHIGVPQLETLLARVSPGKPTLQSMIFEPATRVIYLSTGANAAHGTFSRLDLKLEFNQ
jgi:hypothetical protein